MKKIKLLSVLLTTIFLSISCDNEELDPSLSNNLNNTSTVDYWPSVINNEWNYNQGGFGQSPFKIVSTSLINGFTYYNYTNIFGQFDNLDNSIQLQVRKENNNYFLRYPESTYTAENLYTSVVNSREFLLFDHNKNIGETWSSNYNFTQTTTNLFPPFLTNTSVSVLTETGTMLGINLSMVINNVTYNNIIHFKLVTTNASSTILSIENYWFSKDLGCVKASFSDTNIAINSSILY